MNASLQCIPVTKSKTYKFVLKLREVASDIVAEWSTDAPFEPHWGQICLFKLGERVEWHKMGAATGSRTYKNHKHGAGYSLALTAQDFANNDVEIVSTAVTTHDNREPQAEKSYTFTIALSNVNNQAQLAWSSDAKFRVRDAGQAHVLVNGKIERNIRIDKATEAGQPTEIRWGVGLSAAYTGENYGAQRIDVVRTDTTSS